MSRWWRAYDEAVDDPKLIALTDAQHRFWFNLLCVCSAFGGRLPEIRTISIKLRMQPRKVIRLLNDLRTAGLLDGPEGRETPHNWAQRQYRSDRSTERVKRFRQRFVKQDGNVSGNVSETAPETETETETEKKKKDSPLRGEARKRASRLASDWWPAQANVEYALAKGLSMAEVNIEAEKFRNFWTAKAGKDAAKLDWSATWQNWILRSVEQRGRQNGFDRERGEKLGDVGRRLAAEARQLELAAGVGRPDDAFREH